MSTQTVEPVVISANYFDRDDPVKWLLRKESEGVREATRIKRLIARNVNFRGSTVEASYGCSRVGGCRLTDVTLLGDEQEMVVPDSAVRLHFRNGQFVDEKFNAVEEVKELFLTEGGAAFAVLPVARPVVIDGEGDYRAEGVNVPVALKPREDDPGTWVGDLPSGTRMDGNDYRTLWYSDGSPYQPVHPHRILGRWVEEAAPAAAPESPPVAATPAEAAEPAPAVSEQKAEDPALAVEGVTCDDGSPVIVGRHYWVYSQRTDRQKLLKLESVQGSQLQWSDGWFSTKGDSCRFLPANVPVFEKNLSLIAEQEKEAKLEQDLATGLLMMTLGVVPPKEFLRTAIAKVRAAFPPQVSA